MPEFLHLDKKQWIYVAAGTGAAGLWYWHKRSAANAAAAASGTSTDATDSGSVDTGPTGGDADTTGDGGFGGGGTGFTYGTGTAAGTLSDGTTLQAPGTNAAWVQDAVNYLSGLGQDSGTVLAALGAYTQGGTITSAQQGIVQQALAALGTTPTAVPPTNVVNAPSPSTRTVAVSKGETQKELITAAGETYAQFLSDNPSLAKKGSKVTTGQKVVVR